MCVHVHRSGELRRADGVVRDVAVQVPRCVRYRPPALSHYGHLSRQCLRLASPNGLVIGLQQTYAACRDSIF